MFNNPNNYFLIHMPKKISCKECSKLFHKVFERYATDFFLKSSNKLRKNFKLIIKENKRRRNLEIRITICKKRKKIHQLYYF